MNKEMAIAFARLAGADSALLEAQNKVTRCKRDIVDAFCTVKVGDVVPVNGYAHNGKMMKVERVGLKDRGMSGEYCFKAWGTVLKKDGSPSMNKGDSGWDINMQPLGKFA